MEVIKKRLAILETLRQLSVGIECIFSTEEVKANILRSSACKINGKKFTVKEFQKGFVKVIRLK